jgi:hypothetical protein
VALPVPGITAAKPVVDPVPYNYGYHHWTVRSFMKQVTETLDNKYLFFRPHTSLLKSRAGLEKNIACA